MTTSIYGLFDPRDGVIRYVGRSINVAARVVNHINEGKRGQSHGSKVREPKVRWLKSIIDQGVTPDVAILETVTDEEAASAEQRWIKYFLEKGHDLVNVTNPGEHQRQIVEEKWPGYWQREPESMPADEFIAYRKRLGLSQAKLAKILGYHYSAVSLWETGKRPIPLSMRLTLERIDQLRHGDPTEAEPPLDASPAKPMGS